MRRRHILIAAAALICAGEPLAQTLPLEDGFYLVAIGPSSTGALPVSTSHGDVEFVLPHLLMGFEEIQGVNAQRQRPRTGFFVVAIRLTEVGRQQFGALTAAHVGERVAIVLRGEVVTAPVINEPINGGRLQIDGAFSREEAQALANYLRGAS